MENTETEMDTEHKITQQFDSSWSLPPNSFPPFFSTPFCIGCLLIADSHPCFPDTPASMCAAGSYNEVTPFTLSRWELSPLLSPLFFLKYTLTSGFLTTCLLSGSIFGKHTFLPEGQVYFGCVHEGRQKPCT